MNDNLWCNINGSLNIIKFSIFDQKFWKIPESNLYESYETIGMQWEFIQINEKL